MLTFAITITLQLYSGDNDGFVGKEQIRKIGIPIDISLSRLPLNQLLASMADDALEELEDKRYAAKCGCGCSECECEE